MQNARHDGELKPALTRMRRAVDDLIEPRATIVNNAVVKAPSLYMQLFDSIRGEQGTANGSAARSMPPVWVDAADMLNNIDLMVSVWQPGFSGVPPTVARLRLFVGQQWRPQDTRSVEQIAGIVEAWVSEIEGLLDPISTKYVSAACPACGERWAYRTDSAGEQVRVPALRIVTETGCTCQACGASWGPEKYLFLCNLLGFERPAGVLE